MGKRRESDEDASLRRTAGALWELLDELEREGLAPEGPEREKQMRAFVRRWAEMDTASGREMHPVIAMLMRGVERAERQERGEGDE